MLVSVGSVGYLGGALLGSLGQDWNVRVSGFKGLKCLSLRPCLDAKSCHVTKTGMERQTLPVGEGKRKTGRDGHVGGKGWWAESVSGILSSLEVVGHPQSGLHWAIRRVAGRNSVSRPWVEMILSLPRACSISQGMGRGRECFNKSPVTDTQTTMGNLDFVRVGQPQPRDGYSSVLECVETAWGLGWHPETN